MELKEFVTRVLTDIEFGLQEAQKRTSKKYNLFYSKGVEFDVAVVASGSMENVIEGQAKVGIIEVIGAKAGAKTLQKNEDTKISRINFVIEVPRLTIKEEDEQERRQVESNRRMNEEFSI